MKEKGQGVNVYHWDQPRAKESQRQREKELDGTPCEHGSRMWALFPNIVQISARTTRRSGS